LIQEEVKRKLNSGNACHHSVQNFLSSRLLHENIKIKVYIILYGCETCSLTLREEYTLRVRENRVSRRIFGSKKNEVTGGLIKLHNEEIHNLYSSPSIIGMIKSRRMRWAGHVARMGTKRNAYTRNILVGKPKGKRSLGRPRRRWVDNIKWILDRSDGIVWIGLMWLRIEP
jgi:hypothetical protein